VGGRAGQGEQDGHEDRGRHDRDLQEVGPIQVKLKVAQTIVKGKVKIRILAVSEPIWPQHTVKSVFINTRALPLLEQEVLQLQGANLETISGATDVSVSFKSSLQAALIAAAKV